MSKDARDYVLVCLGMCLGVCALFFAWSVGYAHFIAWNKARAVEHLTGREVSIRYALHFDADLLARISLLPEHTTHEEGRDCARCDALLPVFIEQARRDK